jgi:hypothetical protein
MSIDTYAELARSLSDELDYNPATGDFTWRKSGRGQAKRAGAVAGSSRPNGYTSIKVCGRQWLAHRLAWVVSYAEEPPAVIDHINRDKSDNSLVNLRNGGNGVNELNSKAPKHSPFGIRGVRSASKAGHYQAYVNRRGRFQQLYHGPDFFEACCARKAWEAKFWEGAR